MNDISDFDLKKLYDDYLEFTGHQAMLYPASAVASTMLAQALSIYRAIMSEDDYYNLLEKIGEDKIPTQNLIKTSTHTLQ
jgi:hypothetical protein